MLAALVRDTVELYRDQNEWDEAMERQQAARDRLNKLASEWEDKE